MQVREAARKYGRTLAVAGGTELTCLSSARGEGALCASLYRCRPYQLEVPAIDLPRLSINLSDSPLTGRLEGVPPVATIASRYSMFLTPAGATAHWRKRARSEHVNVYFAPSLFDDAVRGAAFERPQLGIRPRGSGRLVDLLERELRRGESFAGEAVDSLARLLLLAVARGTREAREPGSLSLAALRRVQEYVDARLRYRIGVVDLARVAGLPPSRFARAFTAATGEAPYQFVTRRRVEAAVRLLTLQRALPGEAAERCGFASPQHLAAVLRRRLGVTPTALRGAGARGISELLERGAGRERLEQDGG